MEIKVEEKIEFVASRLEDIKNKLDNWLRSHTSSNNLSANSLKQVMLMMDIFLKLLANVIKVQDVYYGYESKLRRFSEEVEEFLKVILSDVFSILDDLELDDYKKERLLNSLRDRMHKRVEDFSKRIGL